MEQEADVTASVLRYAAQKTLRYLEISNDWQQFVLAEGQFHTGDDPVVADGEAHQEFERAARDHPSFDGLNVWGIVGEENIKPQPTSFNPGTRVFVLDSLDGSSVWAMMRQGYCVASLSLVADGKGDLSFECGVISTPVHTFTLVGDELRYGPSFDGPKHDTVLLSTAPESEVRPKSLAINGYKSRDRPLILEIMKRLPDWDVVTIAGNPANPYVVMGTLTATVNTRPQCTWDALGVVFCTATDAVVGNVGGTVVSGPNFRSLFARLLLEGNVKCVPPMIVAKNLERFQEVSSAVSRALEACPQSDLLEP